MVKNPPLLTGNAEFTATGEVVLVEGVAAQSIPTKYSLQVTGVDAAGAAAAPTAWDVLLLASLDGVTYNEASKIIEHVNGTNGNGDVLFTQDKFYPARFWAIKCKALTLGAPAVKIKAAVLGVE
jgi:hypothetical protein